MATYHLTTIQILDKVRFLKYAQEARPLLERYGGEYLAMGRASGSLEGDPLSEPIVLTRWENTQQLKDFWGSSEYKRLRILRDGAVVVNSTILES